jgi:hypothetical protein
MFLNTIISYALFLVLFAYQEALKFSFKKRVFLEEKSFHYAN